MKFFSCYLLVHLELSWYLGYLLENLVFLYWYMWRLARTHAQFAHLYGLLDHLTFLWTMSFLWLWLCHYWHASWLGSFAILIMDFWFILSMEIINFKYKLENHFKYGSWFFWLLGLHPSWYRASVLLDTWLCLVWQHDVHIGWDLVF